MGFKHSAGVAEGFSMTFKVLIFDCERVVMVRHGVTLSKKNRPGDWNAEQKPNPTAYKCN